MNLVKQYGGRSIETAAAMMMLAWESPTSSTATALPVMIISSVRGETSSCSKVPCSRSLATDRAVRI